MDDVDPPATVGDGEQGVLGNLPPTRPQHRSARRRGPASVAATPASPPTATMPAAVTTPSDAPTRRRAAGKATAAAPAATPKLTVVPDVPGPPPAPRSGWATPEPTTSPAPVPPLVALADGAVRTGAQLLRGVLRRLPGG